MQPMKGSTPIQTSLMVLADRQAGTLRFFPVYVLSDAVQHL